MLKVGVVGAGGRMGQEVCRAVSEAPDTALVAAVDPAHVGEDACGKAIVGEVLALADLGAEVVVDFTDRGGGAPQRAALRTAGPARRHRDERACPRPT